MSISRIDIIPTLYLLGGKVARMERHRDSRTRFSDDPLILANFLRQCGFNRLNVVDIAGRVNGNFGELATIEKLLDHDFELQIDGGLNDLSLIHFLAAIGAKRVVIGKRVIFDLDFLNILLASINPENLATRFQVIDDHICDGCKITSLTLAQIKQSAPKLINIIVVPMRSKDNSAEYFRRLRSDWTESNFIFGGEIQAIREIEELSQAGIREIVIGISLCTQPGLLKAIGRMLHR